MLLSLYAKKNVKFFRFEHEVSGDTHEFVHGRKERRKNPDCFDSKKAKTKMKLLANEAKQEKNPVNE